ncbi:MAG: hypothetical protein SFT93_05710 [Rickettsiaceae bacterium]|nr:hypothetical protein [Rickettsiaceae bacterium]
MTKFKLFISTFFYILLSPLLSIAHDTNILFKGSLDFQSGYFSSNAPKRSEYNTSSTDNLNFITSNQKNLAFYTYSSLGLETQNTLESGFTYGAKIGIATTAKSLRSFQSGIFMESQSGRLELGSEKSAMSKMRITPYSIISGPSESWNKWIRPDPEGSKGSQIPYVTSFANFLDAKLRSSSAVEYSRKITYYSPIIHGAQVGITYIPDSSNSGYGEIKDTFSIYTSASGGYNLSVKNGVSGGIKYTNNIHNNIDLETSAVGEIGETVARPASENALNNTEFGHLRTYNIGAKIKFDDLSFASSYGNYVRSLTNTHDLEKDTKIYGASVRYQIGSASLSAAYVLGDHTKNKIKVLTLATDYRFARGLLFYGEFSSFIASGSIAYSDEGTRNSNHKGSLFLLGARVEI